MQVVCLAGGVGGAKMVEGFASVLADEDLAVVVNTGDDFELYGLYISPDLDTVIYGLAGLRDYQRGWGRADDTFYCYDTLKELGEPVWFALGDRDLALHIYRTRRLREGNRLTVVTAEIAKALGVKVKVFPMCDSPVTTRIKVAEEKWLDFQEYFVKRGCEDSVLDIKFEGIDRAVVSEEVKAVLGQAELIVLCPSNPYVSIAPILNVPGMRELLEASSCPKVAVSPIVGGEALKGPAALMQVALEKVSRASALAVARRYSSLIDGFVLDVLDVEQRPQIEDLGLRCLVCPTVMTGVAEAAGLAKRILEFVA